MSDPLPPSAALPLTEGEIKALRLQAKRPAIAVRQVCNENLQSLQRYPLIPDGEYELQIGDGGSRLVDFFRKLSQVCCYPREGEARAERARGVRSHTIWNRS